MSLLRNRNILKTLEGVHPKFAKHMMVKNDLIRIIATEKFGTVDVLDLPMCRKCEKPATWDKDDTAYHLACGTRTINPITVQQYLMQEYKFPPEVLDVMGGILYPDDEIIETIPNIETK